MEVEPESYRRLSLNIDTGSMGAAFDEIQNEHGNPLPGFSMKD
jgi:hypothetical protein